MALISSRYTYEGAETTDAAVIRVGSLPDGTGQAQSRKIVTSANSQWLRPFKAEPYVVWNPTAGVSVLATMYGAAFGAVLPFNDDIWLELVYAGSSTSPLGAIVNTTKANVLESGILVAPDDSSWSAPPMQFQIAANSATLSADGLTVTIPAVSSFGYARSVHARSSGKYYFEYTCVSGVGSLDKVCGLVPPNNSYLDFTSQTFINGSFGITGGGGIYSDSVTTTNIGSIIANGTTVCMAADLTAHLFWMRKVGGNWNNSGTANPATGVGGIAIATVTAVAPVVGIYSNAGQVVRANFGDTAYAGTAPSGFGNWPIVWTPFKIVKTLSAPLPGMAGYIEARVRAAKANATYYMDPQIELRPAFGGTYNATTVIKSSRHTYEGDETTDTTFVRTGGAVAPTGQQFSHKIVTNTNPQWLRPFKAIPYAKWNSVTSGNVVVTICGMASGILPTNDEIWMDCEYLTSASDTIGGTVTTTKANVLATGTPVASDGSTWSATPHTTYDGIPQGPQIPVLTNGNLTVTAAATSGGGSVKSSVFMSAGKYYFEVTVGTKSIGTTHSIGVATPAAITSDMSSGINTTSVILGTNSFIYSNDISTGKNLGTAASGDRYCFAFDLANRLAWIRKGSGNWNVDAAADPTTGVGGVTMEATSYAPYVGLTTASSGMAIDNFTANFGATAFVGAVPSGFAAWETAWTLFKLIATLPTPGQPSYIHTRIRVGKPSTTYYIDPRIELT